MATKAEVSQLGETADVERCEYASDEKRAIIPKSGVDDALQMALDSKDETWTEEEERRVLWKIDLVLIPLLFLGAVVGYSDGQAYGFAALFGLVEDLKLFTATVVDGHIVLDTSKYQFTSAITSLGGAAVSTISASLSGPAPTSRHRSNTTTFERHYNGYVPLRIGITIAGNAVGSLVGIGVDFGAVKLGGVFATSRWKWIYVILGSCALLAGMVIMFLLPATPMKAWFLTPRERHIAVRRVMSNNTGIHTRKFKLHQALSAFLDPQVYALCIFCFTFAFCNVAISSFGGFLITSFGYSQTRALLLSMPASGIAVVCLVLSGILGSRFPRHRIIIAIAFILPSLMGNIMLWKTSRDNKAALLGGLYISTTFYGSLVQHYSLLAANIGGHSKKTIVMGTITIMGALGGFSGPWAYKGSQTAQGYPDGQIATLSLFCASILAYIILWFYYTSCNAKKATILMEHPELAADPMIAFMDMTDRENPAFQYAR
ncbi:hypothetical protein V499_00785 [Pseudogymnoascus sp. VKM F-103]|nr:hypothetical protein V499_00785 [Pseudogymnoascus sp. VKM F-103]